MALLMFTGMRRGEVLGLRWEDIDYERMLISVQRNVTFPSNQPVITTPKTQHGVRQIPLDKALIALLDKADDDIGFVIGGNVPITLTSYRNTYARIEKRVNLNGATAHVFRHSYLTLLDEAGVDPKTLQSIAGHGDINTTWNRYVHGRIKAIKDAGDKFAALVNTSEVFQTLSEKARSIASTTSNQDDLVNPLRAIS